MRRKRTFAFAGALAPYNILFAALLVIHLLPLWVFEYFPSQDGPSHLNNATIIRNYVKEEFAVFREFYALEHRFGVNWLIHLMLMGLMECVSALTAEKLLLSGYAVCFMLALRYAVLSVNTISLPIAFLGFPLIYTRSMHMGFYSFIFSVAAFLVCVGYWVRHNQEMGRGRTLLSLVIISLLLYLTHILSLFMSMAMIGVMIVWLALLETFSRMSISLEDLGLSWRRVWFVFKPKLTLMVAFAPSVLLLLLFLHNRPPLRTFKGLLREFVSFQRIEAVVFIGLAALIVLLLCAQRDKFIRLRLDRADGLLLATVFSAIIYVVAPTDAFGGSQIHHRLIIYPTLMLILWLAAQKYGAVLKRVIAVGASGLAITGLLIKLPQYKRFNDYLHEYVSAGDWIQPKTSLLPISFTTWASRDVDWFTSTSPDPFIHASGYVAGRKTLVDLGNYEAGTAHFPTVFRDQRNPRQYIGNRESPYSRLSIGAYYENTGKQVDYVLLWSAKGVDKELTRAADLRKQLDAGYRVLYTSPRGLTRVYRRRDYSGSENPSVIAPH
jgi:hypothetical protein